MSSEVQPAVAVHEIKNGNDLDGAAPNGTEVLLFGQRYQKWEQCTSAGLFAVQALVGATLRSISWNLPGITAFNVYLVDEDSVAYLLYSNTSDVSNTVQFTSVGVLVPPGWSVKAVGTGNVTGDGRCACVFGHGWGQSALDGVIIGSEGRVTGPPVP